MAEGGRAGAAGVVEVAGERAVAGPPGGEGDVFQDFGVVEGERQGQGGGDGRLAEDAVGAGQAPDAVVRVRAGSGRLVAGGVRKG